jgi:hypothetical protein
LTILSKLTQPYLRVSQTASQTKKKDKTANNQLKDKIEVFYLVSGLIKVWKTQRNGKNGKNADDFVILLDYS